MGNTVNEISEVPGAKHEHCVRLARLGNLMQIAMLGSVAFLFLTVGTAGATRATIGNGYIIATTFANVFLLASVVSYIAIPVLCFRCSRRMNEPLVWSLVLFVLCWLPILNYSAILYFSSEIRGELRENGYLGTRLGVFSTERLEIDPYEG